MLSKLYAIVDRATLDARSGTVRSFAEQLRDAGVQLVQYRDKRNAPQEVLRAAQEIADVFAGLEAMLILNDRADLAALLGWGVHVGQGDLPVDAVRRVLGRDGSHSSREKLRDEWGTQAVREATGKAVAPSAIPTLATMKPSRRWGTLDRGVIGLSTHNEEQVRAAEAGEADYAAIGPVFATSSKANPDPVVGLEGVRRARALTRKPLVAIGGITLENARSVREAGADSVAVIGGLFVPGRSVRDVARDFLAVLG